MTAKRILAGLALTGALCSVTGTAVAATQYPVQGGTWNYGLNGAGAYSDYYHGSVCHGSSVYTDWDNDRSIDVAGGRVVERFRFGQLVDP
jgi:lactococcin 972 family bacteriocin